MCPVKSASANVFRVLGTAVKVTSGSLKRADLAVEACLGAIAECDRGPEMAVAIRLEVDADGTVTKASAQTVPSSGKATALCMEGIARQIPFDRSKSRSVVEIDLKLRAYCPPELPVCY